MTPPPRPRPRTRPHPAAETGDRELPDATGGIEAGLELPGTTGLPARTASRLQAFIRDRLPLTPVPGLPDIRLHTAHAASGLGRFIATIGAARGAGAGGDREDLASGQGDLDGGGAKPPYWAYPWAGGLALAHHLAQGGASVVAGRRVLDLGTGSGLVAIAAARAGAAGVTAVDIDPLACMAAMLNADANGVAPAVTVRRTDLLQACEPPVDVDCVLVGDLFYDADLARRVLRYLDCCRAVGVDILIGDPDRASLPGARLERFAAFEVADFGRAAADGRIAAGVFRLRG